MTRALAAMAIAIALPAAAHARTLGLEVWTDRGDDAVYQTGDAMQVKVRSSDDSYLLVYEIDATGQVSVLYPWRRGSNLVEGKRTYRLPPENSGYELAVEKATGQGYIVAIASRRPFRDLPWYLRPFDPQGESMGYEDRHDEEDGFDESGKVVGDPMVAMERIRRRVLDHPEATDDFATSYASYYVGHEVRYPRYLCADCHRPGRWEWWDGFDPYYTRCSVFDFRVNWNWCWGPCLWSSHQPYYYYVVRSDCPPRYENWYQDHSRWSSWDGYQQFNQLWGGNLTRHKTPPPVGYQSPVSPTGKPAYNGGGSTPPGYLPPSGNNNRNRGGFREPIGIGRNRPADPTPGVRPGGAGRVPVSEQPPRFTPSEPRTPPASRPPEARPPREQPRQDPPREQPRHEPRQQPRQDPPRQDPPKQQEQPQHHDSPPADRPQRQEPQRQEPQRDRGDRDR
jgi:hypothetical protein